MNGPTLYNIVTSRTDTEINPHTDTCIHTFLVRQLLGLMFPVVTLLNILKFLGKLCITIR